MQSAPCQCQNDEKYSKSCPSFMYHTPLQAADDFHAKTRLTSRIMRVTPEIRFFRPISEEIARLLIVCFLMMT